MGNAIAMSHFEDGGKRMLWVDAMRGFSMLVVVFVHLLTWIYVTSDKSPLVSTLMTFWMPLFFFVSGFFSYKSPASWSRSKLADILKRKIQAQIIGAVFFCALYRYFMLGRISFMDGFGAYWFTIVLFQMYIIYLILSLISAIARRDMAMPVMVVISIVFCGSIFVYRYDFRLAEMLRWLNLAQYFQFFTLGLFCKKYWRPFISLISDIRVMTVLILGSVLSLLLMNSYWFTEQFGFIASFNRNLLVRYLTLMLVVSLFYKYSSALEGNRWYARVLCFIGQRTLDIYFIHFYFLLQFTGISEWLTTGNMVIFQIIYASILTCVVIAMSLLVSFIFRSSPVLAAWLFGEKSRKTHLVECR